MAKEIAGMIVHVNIPSLDLAASQQFYGSLFGWSFRPGGEGYMFFDDGGIGGGLTQSSSPAPDGGIIFYVAVEDMAATLAAVKSSGGSTLVDKTSIGEHGYYAVFADPHGNRIGLNSKT